MQTAGGSGFFEDSDSDFAARSLNRLITLADKRTVNRLADGINAVVRPQITAIQHEISSKRVTADASKLDPIARLQDARPIAAALGTENGSLFLASTDPAQTKLAINMAQMPSYIRGVKALDSEMEILKSRERIEPFINGLRAFPGRLALLEAVLTGCAPCAGLCYTIDDSPRPPCRAASRRYTLIRLIAVVEGLTLGTVMAFIAKIVKGKRASGLCGRQMPTQVTRICDNAASLLRAVGSQLTLLTHIAMNQSRRINALLRVRSRFPWITNYKIWLRNRIV